MKEADKKVWIVPGKIRVASVFFALIVAAVVTTSVVMGDVQRKERAVQEHLAEEVLRFHVLANSDSRTDQAVKMEVRDAVLSYLKEVLPEELDVKETTRWMRGHTEEIRQVAEQKMADLQMQQTVSVAVTTCYSRTDLWRCHISGRKLQDPEDRTGRCSRHNWCACCIRICVFWIRRMQYFLKRESNS